MRKNININMLASIMKGLGCAEYVLDDILAYNTIEELISDNSCNAVQQAKAVVELMEADMFTDALFTKIREIQTGNYSYWTSICCVTRSRAGDTYLEFDLDFDEHYDSLYLDVHTLEIWKCKSDFIEYLLDNTPIV